MLLTPNGWTSPHKYLPNCPDGCSARGASSILLVFVILFGIFQFSVKAADQPKWTITKTGGAYRVNGMKLMANGYLRSESGDSSRELTRQELIEIGEAINAYEAGIPAPETNSTSRNNEPSAPATESPPATNAETAKTPPAAITQAPPETSMLEIGVFVGVLVILLAITGVFIWMPRCPRCGRRSLTKVEFVNDEDDEDVEPGFECNGCGHQWSAATR